MTVTDRVLDQLRSTYEKAGAAHSEAKEAHLAAVQQRDEIKRRAEEAEATIERLQEEAEADALLASPGGGTAVASGTREKLQRLRGQVSELKTRIKTRKKAREEAQEAARRAALELARALRERRSSVAVEYRQHLESIGKAAVGPYRKYFQVRDELAALDRKLKNAVSASGADPRQLQRLRAAIKRGDRGLSGAALLGWLIVVVIGFARHFTEGPMPEFLEAEGIEPLDGSPRHVRPLGAKEQVVADLSDGRLPGGSSTI